MLLPAAGAGAEAVGGKCAQIHTRTPTEKAGVAYFRLSASFIVPPPPACPRSDGCFVFLEVMIWGVDHLLAY